MPFVPGPSVPIGLLCPLLGIICVILDRGLLCPLAGIICVHPMHSCALFKRILVFFFLLMGRVSLVPRG